MEVSEFLTHTHTHTHVCVLAPMAAQSDTYCLRPLEHWDRGFESRSRHVCVSAFFCVVLSYVGSGFATGWFLVQGVLRNVKNRFISFRRQILNRKRPEGLIRIYIYMFSHPLLIFCRVETLQWTLRKQRDQLISAFMWPCQWPCSMRHSYRKATFHVPSEAALQFPAPTQLSVLVRDFVFF